MSGRIFDLEVWISGTPTELDAATTRLGQLGRVVESETLRLAGVDLGRHRRYLRIAITPAPHTSPTDRPTGPSLLDAA